MLCQFGKLVINFMKKKYKITKLSIWRYFYKIVLITFLAHIFTVIAIVFFKKSMTLYTIIIVLISVLLAWLLFFILPLCILYYNHKKFSKSVIFEIDDEDYCYKTKTEIINFSKDDITNIKLWLSPPSYDKRIDFLYFGKYHFATITTKQNKSINLSCLVFDEIESNFPEELVERKKKLFPVMK